MFLKETIEKIGNNYLTAKNEQFADHPIASFIRNEGKLALENALANERKKLHIKTSPGNANWADIPWLAIHLPSVTNSNQKGYYIVYLFSSNMKNVYLCMGQGVTIVEEEFGKSCKNELLQRSNIMRKRVPEYKQNFEGTTPDLKGKTPLSSKYPYAVAFHKKYIVKNLPLENILISDLQEMLHLYNLLYDRGGTDILEDQSFIFGDEEIPETIEEQKKHTLHYRIERKTSFTKKIKKAKGYTCEACGFNFEKTYGDIGKEFIEAHHLTPLSELKEGEIRSYSIDDFAVLCANCHRMIHRKDAPKSVQELKKLLQES